MKMRPSNAMILDEAGRGSSMPYISAFSKDSRASMILGVMMSPSAVELELEAWRSRRVDRRRGALMEVGCVLLESALRLLAIRSVCLVDALPSTQQRVFPSRRRRERKEKFAPGRRGRAILTRSR